MAFANEGDQADNKITTQVKSETISQPQIPIKATTTAVTTKSDIEDLTVDQEGIIGRDEQKRVTDTTKTPYRQVVYLKMLHADGKWYAGSGAMIGPDLILTAAHNVYDREKGKWATYVEASPSRNRDVGSLYGDYSAENYVILSGFQSQVQAKDAHSYDMAVIKLN